MDKSITYLLIGGNLGDRFLNLQRASELISEMIGEIQKKSAVYETAAWGLEEQPSFLNQVLEVATELSPENLLAEIHFIEGKLERQRLQKWGARTMDIDILFYESQVIDTPNLTVPHPYLHLRRFTLVPLCELIPNFVHPILQKTVGELLEECGDELEVEVFKINPQIL